MDNSKSPKYITPELLFDKEESDRGCFQSPEQSENKLFLSNHMSPEFIMVSDSSLCSESPEIGIVQLEKIVNVICAEVIERAVSKDEDPCVEEVVVDVFSKNETSRVEPQAEQINGKGYMLFAFQFFLCEFVNILANFFNFNKNV
jgi:hypothetical protein